MAHLQLPEMPAAPVLELHGQRKVFHIPEGLKMMLEDCTREVLRSQPANLYEFLATLLEDKLVVREFKAKVMRLDGAGGARKSWQWRRWSWDGSSLLSEEELIEFLQNFNISLEMAERLALIIQSAYRGFMARKKFKSVKHDRDLHREELWEEWRHPGNMYVSGHDVLEILAYYKISLFEANAFATRIQKTFRGHRYRKELEATQPELAAHLHSLGITRKVADAHAAKIQSAFRGYMTRKNLKEMESDAMEAIMDEVAEEILEEEEEEEEGEEEEIELQESEYAEDMKEMQGLEEEKPKYEAFFPEGIDATEEEEIQEGLKLPPAFTHEHFGEIDPEALRQKFSTQDFKQKMSQVMKNLEDATEDRRKANLEKVESVRKMNRESRAKSTSAENKDAGRSSAVAGGEAAEGGTEATTEVPPTSN